MEKKIVYVDMDGVLSDFDKAYTDALAQFPKMLFPHSQYGFYRNLPVIKGAKEAIALLNGIDTIALYLLTAPSYKNPLCYTEKRDWVEINLGMDMVQKLIISPNKGLSKGHYLIDDHDSGRGQDCFEGTFIHFGSADFPDWNAVLSFLSKDMGVAIPQLHLC